MNYGYIRVSTDRQSVLNQRHEITRFCAAQDIHVDGWIEETVSGTKECDKRQLGRLLRRLKKDDMIMDILYVCMNKECRVWTVKEGVRLGRPAGAKTGSQRLDENRDDIFRWQEEGLSRKQIAARLGISPRSLYYWLKTSRKPY